MLGQRTLKAAASTADGTTEEISGKHAFAPRCTQSLMECVANEFGRTLSRVGESINENTCRYARQALMKS
jgi:hypothetical protein